VTWAAETTPWEGNRWPGDLALSRFLVSGYHANMWRAEQVAEGLMFGDAGVWEVIQHMQKAADYFVFIQGAIK
jgi:hypothetical protein